MILLETNSLNVQRKKRVFYVCVAVDFAGS